MTLNFITPFILTHFLKNVQQPAKKPRGRAPGRPKGSPNKKRTNPAGSAESEILAALRNGQNIHVSQLKSFRFYFVHFRH